MDVKYSARKQLKFLNYPYTKYLSVGIWNAVFGYFVGVYTYKLLITSFNIVFIGIIANFLSITMSFLTYMLIVFKSKGGWIREYIKCFSVYGFMAIVGIMLLWVLKEKILMNIWLSQFIVLTLVSSLSYFTHKKFTFSQS